MIFNSCVEISEDADPENGIIPTKVLQTGLG